MVIKWNRIFPQEDDAVRELNNTSATDLLTPDSLAETKPDYDSCPDVYVLQRSDPVLFKLDAMPDIRGS